MATGGPYKEDFKGEDPTERTVRGRLSQVTTAKPLCPS